MSDQAREPRTTAVVALDHSDDVPAGPPEGAAPSPSGHGGARRLRVPSSTWLALGLYGLLSVLFFGRHVVGHLGSAVIATNDIDSSQYQWFLAWWPHAILHGLNPFITHAVYVPDGYNLTWTTSLPPPRSFSRP